MVEIRATGTAADSHDGVGRSVVEPRDASSVIVLRVGATAPIEVFMMTRRSTMEFAPGRVVFPGGGVDTTDVASVDEAVSAAWQPRLGASSLHQAAGVLGAAVRELAEETGVQITVDELGLWDAWTTPEISPKRYRTWFFTALLPPGQEALELSTESSSVTWVSPAEALDRADRGEWRLMAPTYTAMLRLAGYDSVEAVMAEASTATVEMFTPVVGAGTARLPERVAELAAQRPEAAWR